MNQTRVSSSFSENLSVPALIARRLIPALCGYREAPHGEHVLFEGSDLGNSWVLAWHRDDVRKQLVFDLDVSLWPGHPAYDPPLPGEHTCYKVGRLVFDDVVDVNGLPSMDEVKPITGPHGSIDYGNIEGFHSTEDGTYEFGIELLDVSVKAGGVRLEINELSNSAT